MDVTLPTASPSGVNFMPLSPPPNERGSSFSGLNSGFNQWFQWVYSVGSVGLVVIYLIS